MSLPDRGIRDTSDDRQRPQAGEAPPVPREIGFLEIRDLVARNLGLIAACALLGGLVAALAIVFLVPTVYMAEAKLLITPLPQSVRNDATGVELYGALATSDTVVERVTSELVAEGLLPKGQVLSAGRDMEVREPGTRTEGGPGKPAFLTLVARHRDPEAAARIVNQWAGIVVQEARALFRGTGAGSESLLESQLEPTNVEIEQAGADRSRRLDELARREEEVTIAWDRRISSARRKAEEAVAGFSASTRTLMEGAVSQNLSSYPGEADVALRSRLQQIVSVRAHLARTPRVLTLEKAVSDDALSEMLAEGRQATWFDQPLLSEEINPLHDELALEAMRLESELKGSLAGAAPGLDALLAALERIQLERSAGLVALEEEHALEQRVLQLRRGRAIEELRLAQAQAEEDYQRRLQQLGGLAEELSGQLNRSVVSRVLDDVEVVRLAVPASAPRVPVSRQMLIKVAIAVFLGAVLGLMIALFRSAGT